VRNTTRVILISIPAFVLVAVVGYFLGGGGTTGLIVGLALGLVVVLVIMLVFGLIKSQTTRKFTGKEGLIGSYGTVKETLNPEGWAVVNGTPWRARSLDGSVIERNERIQVVELVGLTIIVRKVENMHYLKNQ
jgi:membrane-bound ClpP family serine protease